MKNFFTLSLLFVLLSSVAFAQLSGVYSIGTGNVAGEQGHYASLKLACDAINANSGSNIAGDCMFYITSSLTEAENVSIGANTNGYTITFKPYTGVTPVVTFTKTTDNSGLSGGWIIGVKNITTSSTTNYGMTQSDSTEHIVIDGSNTAGGMTRDLSIVTAAGVHANTNPIRIWGNCNYVTLKNLVVATGQSVSYAISITVRNSTVAGATGNYVPDNIIVENCDVTNSFGSAGQGIAISNSGTPTQFPTGMIFRNNKITATTRGIFLNYSGDTDIYGNQIYLNQTSAGNLSEGIYAALTGLSSNVTNIYGNNILLLSTANTTTGSYGILGIYVNTQGSYNVYNNIVTGFSFPNLAQGMFAGIGISSATVNGITVNVYHNSVYMKNGSNTAGATPPIQSAFYLNMTGASGTRVANVKNNIFANDEPDYVTQAVYVTTGNKGTLNSDYNVLYTAGGSGMIGKFGATDCAALSDWQTASSQDANSISGLAQFISTTDLHINLDASPTSVASNYGTTLVTVTTDIDGNLRDATYPDIGASEFVARRGTIAAGTNTNLRINSPDTLLGNVTVNNVLTLNSTLLVGANTLTLNNPIAGSPTNLIADNTSSLSVAGTANGVNIPSNITALNNLTLNNSNGTTLQGNLAVSGVLTFTAGKITTGSNTLTVNGSISSAGVGKFVEGNLALPVSALSIKKWEVGQGSDYLPFTAGFSSVTGSDNISVVALDRNTTAPLGQYTAANKLLQRYFRVTKGSGITAFAADSLVLSYTDGDVSAQGVGEDTLRVFRFDGTNWSAVNISGRDIAANTITVTGVNSFSDFVIAGANMNGISSFSTRNVAFGSLTVGFTKVDSSVVITNNGPTNLDISAITSNDPDMTVLPSTATIAPAASQKFFITYNPSAAMIDVDTLVFTSNGMIVSDTVFAGGTGILPTFVLSHAAKSFGNVLQGSSKKDSVTVTNTGPGTLVISAVASSNPNFTVDPTVGIPSQAAGLARKSEKSTTIQSSTITLLPSETQQFYVTFTPATVASIAGNIVFTYNNIDTSPDTLAVDGIGSVPGFGLSTYLLDYGKVRKSKSKIDSVVVSNSGVLPLNITAVASDLSDFTVTPTSAVIDTSSSQRFYITFSPTSLGLQSANIRFAHDGTKPADTLIAKGIGALPAFSATVSTINFGEVVLGKGKTDSLYIKNTGTDTLHLDSLDQSRSEFTSIVSGTIQYAVAPGDSNKVKITFAPIGLGAVKDTFIVYHDGVSLRDTMFVLGTGVQAAFTVAPKTLSYGSVLAPQTKKDSVVVTNGGTSTLVIDSVKSDNAMFTVSAATNVSVAVSATYKIYITFAPTTAGAKNANIVFYHNAPSKKDTVKASGTGLVGAYFVEDFTPAAGTTLTSAGWTVSSGGTTNELVTVAPGLSFGKYSGSGVGNSVYMKSTGQDVYNTFPALNSGSVYLSFMMKVDSAGTGDYFIALSPSASQTNYYARLHMKKSGTGYVVGISKSNEVSGGAQYGTTVQSFGTTALIVVKYTFAAADTANDPINVYVLTSWTPPTTEPTTAEISGYTTNTKGDALDLAYITLRQGTTGAAPYLTIDGLRVGTSWSMGVPTGVLSAYAEIPTTYELLNNYPNPFNPSTTIMYGLPHESRVSVKIYSLLGQEVRTLVNEEQGASFYQVTWNGRDQSGTQVSSGVYFFRMVAEPVTGDAQPFVQVRKMMLMK